MPILWNEHIRLRFTGKQTFPVFECTFRVYMTVFENNNGTVLIDSHFETGIYQKLHFFESMPAINIAIHIGFVYCVYVSFKYIYMCMLYTSIYVYRKRLKRIDFGCKRVACKRPLWQADIFDNSFRLAILLPTIPVTRQQWIVETGERMAAAIHQIVCEKYMQRDIKCLKAPKTLYNRVIQKTSSRINFFWHCLKAL